MDIKEKIKIVKLSYLKNGIKGLVNLYRVYNDLRSEPDKVSSQITVVKIEATTRCNLKCKMCDHITNSRKKIDMSLDSFKIVLDKLPHLLKISLSGVGEPLLNPHIFEMIKMAKDRNIFVGTFTNGTLLSPKIIASVVNSNLDWLNISIDGATKKTYESIRCGAVFDTVISQVTELVDTIKKVGAKTKITAWMTLSKENLTELPEMVKLVKSIGINRLNIQSLHSWGKDYWVDNIAALSPENTLSNSNVYIRNAIKEAEETGVILNFSTVAANDNKSRTCNWPWRSCNITVDGFVTPCCMHGANPKIINFGNIFKEDFNKIWNSEAYADFRRKLRSANPPAICNKCPGYYYIGF